jgi:hypothetical protein
MNRGGNLFVFLFAFIFLISLTSSQLESTGCKQVNEQITFCQVCQDATYITLSSITSPASIQQINANMTAQGVGQFCYNYTPTEMGRYDLIGISDGCEKSFATYTEVTYTGECLESPQATMYLVVLAFLIGILGYLIYIYPALPKHTTNEQGYVIDVADMSYLRPIVLGVMWILIMSITFIIANIAVAYITAGFLGKFIFGIWTLMMYSNFLILPLWIIYLINDFYKTAKLKEFLERGGMAFG